MKLVKTSITHSCIPSECNHEWRIFGSRWLTEEVYPGLRNSPWIICDNCGWSPSVKEYKVIGERTITGPLFGSHIIDIVEVIKWGKETAPTKRIVDDYYGYEK